MPSAPKWRPLLLRFIDNLRIVSREETAAPGEAGIKIKLWRSQQRILEELTAGMDEGIRRFYVLKSRQLGSTTIFVIIALFWLALHPGMKGALVVDQEKTRDDFREQIRNLIASIPLKYFGAAFAIKKGGDNKYFMAFSNGSQLNFLVAGTSGTKVAWGESSGFSLVLLTEVANYGSPEGLTNFEEAMSEQNPDRLYVYESTAKGFNHWRQRWLAARGDVFTNRCIFVGWWAKEANSIKRSSPLFAIWGLAEPDDRERTRIKVVKERYGWEITPEQLAWHRWRASKDHQTESSLNQNQPWIEEDAFVMSGQSYFQLRRIAHDYERIEREGVAYQGYRFWLGNDFWAAGVENLAGDVLRQHEVQLRMWVPPHPDGRYVLGCDPAGGSDEKNDRHAVSVWRCYADKLVQVAEYADNIAETRQAAWVLAYLAGIYQNCTINIELSGGYGKAVLVEFDHLREILRGDVYRAKRGAHGRDLEDFLDNARYHLYRRPDNPASAGYVTNFLTTGDNKRFIFNEFRDSHVNEMLVINSKPLLEEMQIVVQDGMSIEAPNGAKDDRTFAACLANTSWVQQERGPLLMLGATYAACEWREAGVRPAGNMVDQIVQQYLRQVEAGQVEEAGAAQRWMEERGLA
jgi:hypothetical protein